MLYDDHEERALLSWLDSSVSKLCTRTVAPPESRRKKESRQPAIQTLPSTTAHNVLCHPLLDRVSHHALCQALFVPEVKAQQQLAFSVEQGALVCASTLYQMTHLSHA
eukprot:5159915-Amphidinium_carterae.1